jgi:hypothetical protein
MNDLCMNMKECHSMKLDLLTNATVVEDAIMFVSGKSKNVKWGWYIFKIFYFLFFIFYTALMIDHVTFTLIHLFTQSPF